MNYRPVKTGVKDGFEYAWWVVCTVTACPFTNAVPVLTVGV